MHKMELARFKIEILRAREATELAEAKAVYAATALALAQERASIAELAAAPQRKATELAETAAYCIKHILFTLQQGLHFFNTYFQLPFL